MAAALQGGYVNALPALTSAGAGGGQLTSLSPPNGVTLSTVAPSSGQPSNTHPLTQCFVLLTLTFGGFPSPAFGPLSPLSPPSLISRPPPLSSLSFLTPFPK